MPQAIAEFEKVSLEEFKRAHHAVGLHFDDAWFEEVYETIELPERATSGSAGYDFKSTHTFWLDPGYTVTIPTGIRVKMEPGWFLMCAPRSGLGFKYRLQLDNTVGIIDSDYYNSDNEGHIMLKITNDSKEGKELHVERGQGFAQGIFLPYGVTVSDHAEAVRNGGFGSTGV